MKYERPDFITNFSKPKNTEIKYINGHWYLYERSAVYNPTTKRMHKKSGKMLGAITTEGFIRTKEKVNKSAFEQVEIVELGGSGYLWQKNQDIVKKLQKYFPDYWREIFAIAAMRITESPRFKRIDDAYETSALSVILPHMKLDKSYLSPLLKAIGRRRNSIIGFMHEDNEKLSSYMVFDGHRIISDSTALDTAQMGFDTKQRHKDQINLVYAFSVSGESCFPYYYKQFSGDVPDITAFSALVKEAGIDSKKLTLLADKGFGSEDNFDLIDDSGYSYIIPIKRSCNDVKDNLPLSFVGYDDAFTYQGRAILHKSVEKDGYIVHLYLDSSLFANELSDFTARLEKGNNTTLLRKQTEEKRRKKGKNRLTDEEFASLKAVSFSEAYSERMTIGTLAIRTNSKDLDPMQVYCLYKRRQAIEDFFKSYDNSLDFSSSYMRDSYTEEAWLFLNHISAMMAFSVLDELYRLDKTKEYSLNDFISSLSKIHADKVNDLWHCAKITKKRQGFASAFELDLHALINEMNAVDAISST
jgi:hypothetical protein